MSGMGIIDSLKQIRSTWLTRISHHMARGEGVRAGFLEELNQFYDLLLQAIESGDPTWMDSLLEKPLMSLEKTWINRKRWN